MRHKQVFIPRVKGNQPGRAKRRQKLLPVGIGEHACDEVLSEDFIKQAATILYRQFRMGLHDPCGENAAPTTHRRHIFALIDFDVAGATAR